jgi:hypothetical protein
VAAAAEDEVSAAIASLFSGHAQQYQALSAHAAAFHSEFTRALSAWYCCAWPENKDAIAADTSSSAAAATAVVWAAADAWAALSDEPMPATSAAAAATISGIAIR